MEDLANISPEHKVFWSLSIKTLGIVAHELLDRNEEKRGTDEKLSAVANLAMRIWEMRR